MKIVKESLYNIFNVNEEIKWDKNKVAGKKIIPPQYVYHLSDKINRDSILTSGLKPSVGESYSSWVGTKNNIPAIFATITNDIIELTRGGKYIDVWQIDTTKIENEWFIDKHFDFFNEIGIKNPHIITFENIPKYAIDLIVKQK